MNGGKKIYLSCDIMFAKSNAMFKEIQGELQ